jgi:sugar phosphate isomerase/epimerase
MTMALKYSFMTFSTPKLTLAEVLAAAKRYGYDGIEPRLDAGHAHGIEVSLSAAQRQAVRRQVADSGVTLACLATSLRYANPEQTETMVADTLTRIDLAADVGASAIRVFGGQIPKDLPRPKAIELVAGALRGVTDRAAARQVAICLETHDDWCDPRHVAAVLGAVNHPCVAANWDIMHPVRTRLASVGESFRLLRPWVRHLHVHDGAGPHCKLAPIGTGDIDHRVAIECLVAAGYQHFVSGEWIDWEPYEQHLPRELATLRALEAAARKK